MKDILEKYISDVNDKKEKIIKRFMNTFDLSIEKDLYWFKLEIYMFDNTEKLLYKGYPIYHTQNMESPRYGINIYEDWASVLIERWKEIINE
jgi:hypothetical protein